MDLDASCTYTHLLSSADYKSKCDISIHLHLCKALTHTFLVCVYFIYMIKTAYHNMTDHCWDVMYRLISMVTMPLYRCVGSGLIANQNWGFGVLLGRLLYTSTAGRLFPLCWRQILLVVLTERSIMWSLCLKSTDKMLSGQHTGNAYYRYAEVAMRFQLWLSWLLISVTALLTTVLYSVPFTGFFPLSPSHKSVHMTAPIRNESYDKQLVTSAWDSFAASKLQTLTAGTQPKSCFEVKWIIDVVL